MTQDLHQEDHPALIACTISRDVQLFDLLIEDMEAALGEAWGDLSFAEAAVFLEQPEAAKLSCVVLAIDAQDEPTLAALGALIATAKERGLGVILVADDVAPVSLHQLLREGTDEFIPYPLPEGELAAALSRIPARNVPKAAPRPTPQAAPQSLPQTAPLQGGRVIAVQPMAGGTGATTLAVNLAAELTGPVCLIDLSLQFGNVAEALSLPRTDALIKLLAQDITPAALAVNLQSGPADIFVLTAPASMVAFDLITTEEVAALIASARASFANVVIDLPAAMLPWTEAVLNGASHYLAVLDRSKRAVENTLRVKTMLTDDGMDPARLHFVLNRAPSFADLGGRAKVKTIANRLGLPLAMQLAEGGAKVADAAEAGLPLLHGAPKNPLRRDIAKLAQSL